jgi:hypothetical protein
LIFSESTCSGAYQVSDGFSFQEILGQQVPQHDVGSIIKTSTIRHSPQLCTKVGVLRDSHYLFSTPYREFE